MKSFQVEAWAIRVIESVRAGKPNEDFKVELKSDWPDTPQEAAVDLQVMQMQREANPFFGSSVLTKKMEQ